MNQKRINHPTIIETLKDINKIVCGADHSYAISQQKNVYAWGCNNNQKLGLSDQQKSQFPTIQSPQIIEKLIGKDITDLATGLDHSYAWSQETGEVYGWGSVEFGKLGFGIEENSDNKFIQQPQLFEVFTELSNYGWSIQNIACGYNHTLAVVNIYSENGQQQDDIQQLDQEFEEQKLDSYRSNKQFQRGDFDEKQNQLFVWGHSKDWQLGLETEEQEDVNHPHKLEQTQKIWKNGIKQVSATKGLSMVLTNDGNVYSWGSGEFGRLGYFSETKIQKTPKLIQFKTQLKIKSISAGFYHCLLLTDQGKIYSFGRGTSGQLGLGNFLNQETPQIIQQLNDIIQIKSGESHNLALNKQGHVYSWGINNQGQLGLCDFNRQNQPQIVNKLNQIQIKQIQCGKKHSLALSNDGQVYAWGCNEFGQIGIEGKKHNTQIQSNQQLNNSANIFQNNNSFLTNLNTLNKGRNINNYSNNTNYKALSQMSSQDYSWLGQQNFNNILDMSNQSQNNQCDAPEQQKQTNYYQIRQKLYFQQNNDTQNKFYNLNNHNKNLSITNQLNGKINSNNQNYQTQKNHSYSQSHSSTGNKNYFQENSQNLNFSQLVGQSANQSSQKDQKQHFSNLQKQQEQKYLQFKLSHLDQEKDQAQSFYSSDHLEQYKQLQQIKQSSQQHNINKQQLQQQQQMSQKYQNMLNSSALNFQQIQNLQNENKELKQRIRELELKENQFHDKQDNIFQESYSCLKQVKQQYLTEVQNQSELEYEILKQNQNLDNNNIDKIKGDNSQAAYFCVDLMDKFNRILKEKNNIILKDNL